MSTVAASLAEIEFALQTAKDAGATDISLLHCVLNYPTPEKNAQLGMIEVLKRVYPDTVVGYSDHVCPDATISALEAAMLLGAAVLEKHFTHDKALPGNDHYHAMNKADLQAFIAKANKYKVLISTQSKDLSKEMAARTHARRSIVINGDLSAGHVICENDIIAKRPAHGISPIHWDEVIGKTVTQDLVDDELLAWGKIELFR